MIDNYNNISRSAKHSRYVLDNIEKCIKNKKSDIYNYVSVYAVGSYGRLEASDQVSDFEWLLVYDDKRVNEQEAIILQAKMTRIFAKMLGRDRLSIGKTFGETIAVSDLISNIGGIADSNRMLTYRMLCLAEGTPMLGNQTHDQIITKLSRAYGGSHTAGHRMLSFATDIARYWRTLRIDYKQKVDEVRLPWAVRGMKLRGSRRFWYFSMACHFVAKGPRIDYDRSDKFDLNDIKNFMSSLSINPSIRLVDALGSMGSSHALTSNLLNNYNEFIGLISDKSVRDELDLLDFVARHESEVYLKLRRLLKDMHSQMAVISVDLPQEHRQQLVEMFLL